MLSRISIIALMLATASCGGSTGRTGGDAHRTALLFQPAEGARYELLHEERRVRVEDEQVVRTRVTIELDAPRPDGARRAHAIIVRYFDGADAGEAEISDPELRSALVDLELSPTGEVVGEPETACGSFDEDLRIGRYLRHLFSLRVLTTPGVEAGTTFEGRYQSDASELDSPARIRIDEVHDAQAEGRLMAELALEDGDIGSYRVSGHGRVRGRFTVDLTDGFSGTSEVHTTVEDADLFDVTRGRQARGTIETTSRLVVRRIPRGEVAPPQCEFDVGSVTRAVQERVGAIKACYEEQLRHDPTLAGRLEVGFAVHQDGRLRGVQVQESTFATPEVGDCVKQELEAIRVYPPPMVRPVRFTYPFVFRPDPTPPPSR